MPIALRPRVGGDRLLALVGERAVARELEAERRREAFALRIARLAVDDHRDHAVGAADRLEAADFLVDVLALRRVRRADDDQELRGFERGDGLLGERMAGGKILAVAKNRPQRLRHRPRGRLPPHQILVDAVAFELAMQPLAPRRVAVAVAQERAVLDRDGLDHASPPRSGVRPVRLSIGSAEC